MLSHFSHIQLCDPMDHSPPGFSIHGILQAGILEWVAIPSTGVLPDPGIEPASLLSPALAGRFFTTSPYLRSPLHSCTINISTADKTLNKPGSVRPSSLFYRLCPLPISPNFYSYIKTQLRHLENTSTKPANRYHLMNAYSVPGADLWSFLCTRVSLPLHHRTHEGLRD